MQAPRTVEEALKSPSGRPLVPLVAFGFGGRVIIMVPRASPLLDASGGRPLALGPLQLLKTQELASAVPFQSAGAPVQVALSSPRNVYQ